jgi:hypothetical protein
MEIKRLLKDELYSIAGARRALQKQFGSRSNNSNSRYAHVGKSN